MSVVDPLENGEAVLDDIRVLHVDDETDFAALTATILEREGEFSVTTETSARDGLARLDETAFDCVVSDYEMPGMDGLEFLEAVRECFPELPFILYTGKGSEDVAADAIEAGVTAYQQKESGTAQYTVLANRIRSHVDQYRTKREANALKQEYGLIAEMATDVFWVFDPATDSASLSDGVTQFGYDPDEIDSPFDWWCDRIHPDDYDRVQAFHDAILDREPEAFDTLSPERGVASIEYRFRKADGSYARCESNCIVLFEDERPVKMAGALTDITELAGREKQLEQERDRRAALFESAVDPVIECRLESGMPIIEQVNPAFKEVFGVEAADVVGKSVAETVVPDDRHAEHEALTEQVRNGNTVTAEVRRETTDGLRDFLLQVVPVERYDADPRLYAWYTDITEQRERERTVEAEWTFINQALDLLEDVFYVVNTDGRLDQWNNRFTAVTGYTDEEVADMDAVDFFPSDEKPRIAAAIEETLTTGRTTVEAEFLTADGDRIPYEFTGARLTDAEGSPLGLVGIGRDISEHDRQRTVLSALHETTEKFMDAPSRLAVANHAVETAKTVLSMPFNAVWLYDTETEALQPTAWTDAAADLIGEIPTYADSESLSWQVFESGDARVYHDLRGENGRYNPETPIRSEIILPLGEYGVMNIGSLEPDAFDDIDVSLARILSGMVEAAFDRADREQELRTQRHELERQNERLEEFASVISHDLRNPLSVAEGRLELARNECDSDHLNDIEHSLGRMEGLLEDLLALARQGKTVSDLEPIDLAEIAADSWDNVDTAEATLRNDADCTVRGDDGRLKQLLENLFRNSIEHGGSGVTVTVGASAGSFYVEDDGPGIRETERDAVFETGYSLSDGGTGLGLSIVKRIAEAHGWDVTVAESDTGGTRFEFTGVETDC